MTIENATQTTGSNEGVNQDIMQMLGHMPSAMAKVSQVEQTTARHDDVISKLEKVFTKGEPAPDGWYDDVLRTAMEAEKAGQPIPLTLKISTELLEAQKQNAAMMKELEALKQRENIKSNPEFQMNQAAFTQIDQYMAQTLEHAFEGNIPKQIAAAVTQDLVEKITEEQRVNPQRWAQIRTNPQMMQTIVRNAVSQFIPPEARRIANQHHTENQEYSAQDALNAINEAKELLQQEEVRNNPALSRKIEQAMQKSREMYWETMIPGQNRRSRV
jgi:hypothetical protein